MRCYRKLKISNIDHVAFKKLCKTTRDAKGKYNDLLTVVKNLFISPILCKISTTFAVMKNDLHGKVLV